MGPIHVPASFVFIHCSVLLSSAVSGIAAKEKLSSWIRSNTCNVCTPTCTALSAVPLRVAQARACSL